MSEVLFNVIAALIDAERRLTLCLRQDKIRAICVVSRIVCQIGADRPGGKYAPRLRNDYKLLILKDLHEFFHVLQMLGPAPAANNARIGGFINCDDLLTAPTPTILGERIVKDLVFSY
jgi:hypothetical protein